MHLPRSILSALLLAAFAPASTAICQTPAAPNVPPPTICPAQDFSVHFPNGSDTLNEEALRAFAADLDRARPCNVLVAIVVSCDLQKAEAVRDAMVGQGLPAAYTHVVRLDAAPAPPHSYERDLARVVILFH